VLPIDLFQWERENSKEDFQVMCIIEPSMNRLTQFYFLQKMIKERGIGQYIMGHTMLITNLDRYWFSTSKSVQSFSSSNNPNGSRIERVSESVNILHINYEDIDAGVRLWEVGPLAYAPAAQVLHTFEPDVRSFVRRFMRYGKGNRRLSVRYQVDLTPQRFRPRVPSALNHLLARAQFVALRWGYATTRPTKEWTTPLPVASIPKGSLTSEPVSQKTRTSSVSQIAFGVAVFIDGDPIAPQHLQRIREIVGAWGPIEVCRVYRKQPSSRWEQLCQGGNYPHLELILEEINPDLRLAMDVEALLQTTTIRRFCLVSNDGDFASVARRLKEVGQVIGIGAANAAKTFRRECHLFIPLDQATSIRSLRFPDEASLMALQAK
jgi:uncharacterized LabA/DUF88 family protein